MSTENKSEIEEIVPSVDQANQSDIPLESTPEQFTPEAISDTPPPIYEENRSKLIFIVGGAIIFLIIFILIVKFILGLGGSAGGKVTLKYWGLWEDAEIIQPLIADYKRKNPNVNIIYTKMDPKSYREKIIARNESVTDRPDIFRFHNTWLPQLSGVTAPLPKSVMSSEEFEKTFYEIAQQDLKVGNDYYGIPLEIDGLVLVCNEELLKASGIESPPTSWDQVVDYASKMTVKDGGKIVTSGIAIGTANNIENFSDILGWMIMQNGGQINNLASKEAIEALQNYRAFAEPTKNLWDENMANSVQAFAQNQVAMIIVPSWQILTIKQMNPDIKLKSVALPVLPGGNPLSLATYWVEGVSRYSQNQQEAWKFLRFLVEKDNLTKLYQEQRKARPFGEPYSRVDLGKTLVQNEFIGAVIAQAPNMKSMPLSARTYDNGLNDEIIKYLEDAVNATAKSVPYAEAFATADKGVKQVFTKYKIQ